MKNLTFHIVGLTHNDVKGHEVEYAKEAEGRTICLVPDDANPFDMLAVKAYDKQLFIGYVSALEGEDVRALIIARKGRNLRTRCLGSNSKEGADEKLLVVSFHSQHIKGIGVIGHKADGSALCLPGVFYLTTLHVVVGKTYYMEFQFLHCRFYV